MSSKNLSTERLFPARINDLFRPWEEWFDGKSLYNGKWQALTTPAVNVSESKKSYELSLAAPGMSKDDFRIDIEGNMLTISAEKEENKEESDEKYSRQEYNYSSFSRSFTLPDEVSKDKIEANYDNGILYLTLPKAESAKKSGRQIEVQ